MLAQRHAPLSLFTARRPLIVNLRFAEPAFSNNTQRAHYTSQQKHAGHTPTHLAAALDPASNVHLLAISRPSPAYRLIACRHTTAPTHHRAAANEPPRDTHCSFSVASPSKAAPPRRTSDSEVVEGGARGAPLSQVAGGEGAQQGDVTVLVAGQTLGLVVDERLVRVRVRVRAG